MKNALIMIRIFRNIIYNDVQYTLYILGRLGDKNDVLTRITEPSNNDYGNDGSDYNFVTFDDFCVKNALKENDFFPVRCSLSWLKLLEIISTHTLKYIFQ